MTFLRYICNNEYTPGLGVIVMKSNKKSVAFLVVTMLTTGLFLFDTGDVYASVSRKGKTWNEDEIAAVAGTNSSMTYNNTKGYVFGTALKLIDNTGKTAVDGFSVSAAAIGGTLNVEGNSRSYLQSGILDKGKIHIGKNAVVTTYGDTEVYGNRSNWTGYKIKDYYTGYTYHTLSSKDGKYNGTLQSDGVLNSRGLALLAGGSATINKGTISPFTTTNVEFKDETGNTVGNLNPAVMAGTYGNLKATNTVFNGVLYGTKNSKFNLKNTKEKGIWLETGSTAYLNGGRVYGSYSNDNREAINNSKNYSALIFDNGSYLNASSATFDKAISAGQKGRINLYKSTLNGAIMSTEGSNVTLTDSNAFLKGISATGSEYDSPFQDNENIAIGIGADSALYLKGKTKALVQSDGNPVDIYDGGTISVDCDATLQSYGFIQVDNQDDFMGLSGTHSSGRFISSGTVVSNGFLVQNGGKADLNGKKTVINKSVLDPDLLDTGIPFKINQLAVAAKDKDASITIANGIINGVVAAIDSGKIALNNTNVQGDALYAQGNGSKITVNGNTQQVMEIKAADQGMISITNANISGATLQADGNGSSITLDGDTKQRYSNIQSISGTNEGKVYISGGTLESDFLRAITSESDDKGIVLDSNGQIKTKTGEIFAKGIDTTTNQAVRDSKDSGDVTNHKIDFHGGTVIFTDNKYTDNYVNSTSGKLGLNTKITMTGQRIEGDVKDVSEIAQTPDVLLDGVMANSQGTSLVVGTAANASHITDESGVAVTEDTQFIENGFRASSLNLQQGVNNPSLIITNNREVSLGGTYEGSLIHVGDEDNYQHAKIIVGTRQPFSSEDNTLVGNLHLGDKALSQGKNFYINGDIQINNGEVTVDAGNVTVDSIFANSGNLLVSSASSLGSKDSIALSEYGQITTEKGSNLSAPNLIVGNDTPSSAFAYLGGHIQLNNTILKNYAQMYVSGEGNLGNITIQGTSSLLDFDGSTGKEIYTANSITTNKKSQLQIENGIFSAPSLRKMTSKAADGSVLLKNTGVLKTTTGQVLAKGINTSSDKKAKDSMGAGSITNKKISFAGGTVHFTDSRYGEKYLDSARRAMQSTRNTWYTMSGKYVDGKSIDIARAASNNKVLRDKVTVNSGKKNLVIGYSNKDGRNFTDSGVKIEKSKANFVSNGFRASKLNLGKYSNGLVITNGRYVTLGGSTSGDLITVNNKRQPVKIAVGLNKNITKNKKEVTKGYLYIGDNAVGFNSKYTLNGDISVNKGSELRTVTGNTYVNSIIANGLVAVNNNATLNTTNYLGCNGSILRNSGAFKANLFTAKANTTGKLMGEGKTVIQNLNLQDNSKFILGSSADLQVSAFHSGKNSLLEVNNSQIQGGSLSFSNSTLKSGQSSQITGDIILNNNSTAQLSGSTVNGNLLIDNSSSANFGDGDVEITNTLTNHGNINAQGTYLSADTIELSGSNSSLTLQGTSLNSNHINISNGGWLYAQDSTINGDEISINPDGNVSSNSVASFADSNLTDTGIVVDGEGDVNIAGGTHSLNRFIVKSGYGSISNATVYIKDGGAIGSGISGCIWFQGRSILKGDNLWDVMHQSWDDNDKTVVPEDKSIHIDSETRVDTQFNQIFKNNTLNEKLDYTHGKYVLHGDYTRNSVKQAENLLSDNGYYNGESKFILLGHNVMDNGEIVTDMTTDEAAGLPNFLLDNVTVHSTDGQLVQNLNASHLDAENQNDVYIRNGASIFLASQDSGRVVTNTMGNLPDIHVGDSTSDSSDAGNLTVGDWYYGKNTNYQFGNLYVTDNGSVTLNPGRYTFDSINASGKIDIDTDYYGTENTKIETYVTAPQVHLTGNQANFSMNDAALTGNINVENGGTFYAYDSQVIGDVTGGYDGNIIFTGSSIQGNLNTDYAEDIELSDTTISNKYNSVYIKDTKKGHFLDNVSIEGNLVLENSPIMLVDESSLKAKNITIKGTGGLYTDTDKGADSSGSTITANTITINENNSYKGQANVTMDRVNLTGDDKDAYRLYVDMGSTAVINQLNLSNGYLRVSNNAKLTINNWANLGTSNYGGVIDNSKNQDAKILAKGGTITANHVKILNTDLIAQNNNSNIPGVISHFDGSIYNNRIVATGTGSSITLNGRNGSNTVFAPKVALGGTNGAKIYIYGGILKADSLRKITSAPIQIQNVNQKADSKSIILNSDGIIQTLTGQLFAKGINTSSDKAAKASTNAGNMTNDKIDLQKGNVLFDDKRYGEKYLASAAKTMSKYKNVWFTMNGKYVDSKTISPATAIKNEKVLRDKVTVNSSKKNIVVGIDLKKKSTFTENGVKIDKNNSEFVSSGFRASKLNLASGSNGLIITGGKTLTLGGSQSGELITTGNKKGKWNIVIGTTKNRLGKSGNTTGRLVLGDGAVGTNAKNSASGTVLINKNSTLEQIGNTMSLDTIYNKGTMYIHKISNMNVKNLQMYDGSSFNGWGISNIAKLAIMPKSTVTFTGNLNTNVNELDINNNYNAYFGNRLNAKTIKGNHAYVAVTNGGIISVDNMEVSNGYFELQGANPYELINRKSADVSINKKGLFDNTEIHVYPNSELKFGEDAKVYLKNNSKIVAESNTNVSFGDDSEIHVEADDNKNVKNAITVPEGENTAINISDSSKLVVANAVIDGSVYNLSNVVQGSSSMWKQIYGNDTNFIEGKKVNDDLHYKFEVIPVQTMRKRFAKLMTANTVAATLNTTNKMNGVDSAYHNDTTNVVTQNNDLTQSEKARNYIVSVSKVGTPVEQTVTSLNHLAGLNGLAMVKRGLYSFAGIVGDAVIDHQVDDSNVWAGFLRNDESSNGIKIGTMHDGYKLNYNGAIVGYDLHKTGTSRTGLAIAYADGDSYTKDANSTKDDMKYYSGEVYHMKDYGNLQITLDAGYVHSSNDISQWNAGQHLTASTHGNGVTAGIYLNKRYQMGSQTLAPFMGLRYMHLQNNNFTDSFGFRHQSESLNTWKLPVGVVYEYNHKTENWNVSPRLKIGYSFAIGDKGYRDSFGFGNGLDSFEVDVAENSWFVEPGIEISKNALSLGAYFRYQKGDDISSRYWKVQLGYKF